MEKSQKTTTTTTSPQASSSTEKYDEVYFKIPFTRMAIATVSLPMFGLLYCFLTCVIFKPDMVNETVCSVDNFIPSASAVTGVSPQNYIWRFCIALHCCPRLVAGRIFSNFLRKRLHCISEKSQTLYLRLISLNYWLYMIENFCLMGSAYISNRENYPIHEKIFVVFMVTSLCYMLLHTILYRWSRPGELTPKEQKSFWWKKMLFFTCLAATAALCVFFYQHRVLCLPLAFSGFSASEYVIAYGNMAYHMTIFWDFGDHYVIAGRPKDVEYSNGTVSQDTKKTN